jgi:hypothetical protein
MEVRKMGLHRRKAENRLAGPTVQKVQTCRDPSCEQEVVAAVEAYDQGVKGIALAIDCMPRRIER